MWSVLMRIANAVHVHAHAATERLATASLHHAAARQ
jgi:hypothetical protein